MNVSDICIELQALGLVCEIKTEVLCDAAGVKTLIYTAYIEKPEYVWPGKTAEEAVGRSLAEWVEHTGRSRDTRFTRLLNKMALGAGTYELK